MSGYGAEIGLDLLQNGANGLVLSTDDVRKAGIPSLLASIAKIIEKRMEMSHAPDDDHRSVDVEEDGGAFLGLPEEVEAVNVDMEEHSVTKQVKLIVGEERVLLTAMVDFVKEASPDVRIS